MEELARQLSGPLSRLLWPELQLDLLKWLKTELRKDRERNGRPRDH
jgi:hypothetical protein